MLYMKCLTLLYHSCNLIINGLLSMKRSVFDAPNCSSENTNYLGADLKGGRGDQAPLPPQDTWIPLKLLCHFWDETMKKNREGRGREGEEEEES